MPVLGEQQGASRPAPASMTALGQPGTGPGPEEHPHFLLRASVPGHPLQGLRMLLPPPLCPGTKTPAPSPSSGPLGPAPAVLQHPRLLQLQLFLLITAPQRLTHLARTRAWVKLRSGRLSSGRRETLLETCLPAPWGAALGSRLRGRHVPLNILVTEGPTGRAWAP